MKVQIEYAENIIVAVVFKGDWKWYVTEKDYWFLDLVKLDNAFVNKGYESTSQGDYSDRFNIAVLDGNSVEDFLKEISEFEVGESELRDVMLISEKTNTEDNNYLEFIPALLVDFDNEILYSCFPEPASFESYVPDGWSGMYKDFLDKVPDEEKYWIINTKNYFLNDD